MLSSILQKIVILIILALLIPFLLGYLIGWGDVIASTILFIFLVGIPFVLAYCGFRSPWHLLVIDSCVAVPCIIVAGLFAYRQTYFQVPYMALEYYLIAMLIFSFIGAFVFYFYKDEWIAFSVLPLAFTIVALVLSFQSIKVGKQLSLKAFKKRLPKYEELVEMVQTGRLKPDEAGGTISTPEGYKHLAHYIRVRENEDGVTQIFFSWALGFPCMHTDYIYCPDGKSPYSAAYEVTAKWYRVTY